MIRNYIKIAWRSLIRNKVSSIINISGLAIGLACVILIGMYVKDELGYDRFFKDANRIYRVNLDGKMGNNQFIVGHTPPPAGAALLNNFPEIESYTRMLLPGDQVIHFEQNGQKNSLTEKKLLAVDANFLKFFNYPLVAGSASTCLNGINSVVITQRAAKKYFGDESPIGKTLTFDGYETPFVVTAELKDIPNQSSLQFDVLQTTASMPVIKYFQWSWVWLQMGTYIKLKPNAANSPEAIAKLQKKFPAMVATQATSAFQRIGQPWDEFKRKGGKWDLKLQPLTDLHLYSADIGTRYFEQGDIKYVYIFSAIALFIMLLACVNFMNLSTARSANRAREVGVRKVLGSPRKYLIFQFLAESIMVTLAGAVIAVIAAWLLLPLFNNMADKELTITRQILVWLIPILLLIIVFIGVLAGSYPAFFLSGFQPIQVLKGKLSAGFKGGNLRSFLVVFQFAISIFLIIGTLVIYNQLKYIQNKDLGFNRNHVFTVWDVYTLGNKASSFKEEIKQLPGVQSATLTGALPTTNYANSSTVFKGPVADQKNGVLLTEWYADEDYVPTLGLKILAGRNFSHQMVTDTDAVLINEAAAKMFGYANPINHVIYDPQDPKAMVLKPYHIIGVMKDFNYQSLRNNVGPMVLFSGHDLGGLTVRASNTAEITALLSQVKAKWAEFSPNQTLNYSFMDQDFDKMYRSEQRVGGIAIAFTSLAIIIACLGLFGLAAYAAEQRTKEIGIRKVLGASMSTIVGMLSRDFIKLVLISIVIASPFAWYFMNRWFLQGFAYRQDIQWWVFALAAVAAILIAFVTISFQSIKAALTNPVKSLRSE